MTRRKAPLAAKKVAALYGAKRPLPIVERSLTHDPDLPLSPARRLIQGLAAERSHEKRLGADPPPRGVEPE